MDLEKQFERMKNGDMYDDFSPELVELRLQATNNLLKYNQSFGQPDTSRLPLLKRIVGHLAGSAHFETTFRCEFGRNISIGDNFYANYDCIMLDGAPITIGDNVLFGPRTGIFTTNHAIDPLERRLGGCYAKPVVIEDDVWFGANVTVNPGVTIGQGSIIGSGSVVTQDIPPMVIAAGAPCKVIRQITDKDKTDYLETGLLH